MLKEEFEDSRQEVRFNESYLLETVTNKSGFQVIERYVEIYKCLLEQKMTTDFQDTDIKYGENMHSIFKPNEIIPEMEHSEKWKSTEMVKLAYAA